MAARRSSGLSGSCGGDPLRSGSPFLWRFALGVTIAAWLAAGAFAAEQPSEIPAWLKSYVGEGEGQIAAVVLQRARALYLRKVAAGLVKNPCYFAMDATRPSEGGLGKRFYEIREADQSFRAMSAGHGSGRNIKGAVNFANGRECAKNFGNALDSNLTTGGAYVTAETKTSFKGYFRNAAKQEAILMRSFVQFEASQDRGPARGTLRFHVHVGEAEALAGEPVDTRGRRTARRAAAVDAQFAVAEIIDQHKQDVGLPRRCRLPLRGRSPNFLPDRSCRDQRGRTEQNGASIESADGRFGLIPVNLHPHLLLLTAA